MPCVLALPLEDLPEHGFSAEMVSPPDKMGNHQTEPNADCIGDGVIDGDNPTGNKTLQRFKGATEDQQPGAEPRTPAPSGKGDPTGNGEGEVGQDMLQLVPYVDRGKYVTRRQR